jgi:hypothetical protein
MNQISHKLIQVSFPALLLCATVPSFVLPQWPGFKMFSTLNPTSAVVRDQSTILSTDLFTYRAHYGLSYSDHVNFAVWACRTGRLNPPIHVTAVGRTDVIINNSCAKPSDPKNVAR